MSKVAKKTKSRELAIGGGCMEAAERRAAVHTERLPSNYFRCRVRKRGQFGAQLRSPVKRHFVSMGLEAASAFNAAVW
jgi:hypothetical protein